MFDLCQLRSRLMRRNVGAYHVGDSPDDRTMSTLEDHGIVDYKHEARKASIPPPSLPLHTADTCPPKFHPDDLDTFDFVFAMDKFNLSDLQRLQRGKPDSKAKVMLFGEYSGSGKAEVVMDPYYGGRDGFAKAYEQCKRFARNFLKEVVEG